MVDDFAKHIEPVSLDATQFRPGALDVSKRHGVIQALLRPPQRIESRQKLDSQLVPQFASHLRLRMPELADLR